MKAQRYRALPGNLAEGSISDPQLEADWSLWRNSGFVGMPSFFSKFVSH
ncbi:hypothetical protein RMSM_06670 [Rhodopirellula maiorica SM1]|uniref:Uncharacterized protein n=1 Tax=Rhodopirellula maiorica SM1 TaxID=1265738 RepID=M5RAK2_9BACT|nr:hypothetical protein RMSM_06670 [Rhodopirellula maiorica SM1]